MQHMYTCGNCRAPIAYGQQVCSNCGVAIDWSGQQVPPPPYSYQQPNQQQSWGQQQQTWGQQQQPGWEQQQPPYNQQPGWGQQAGYQPPPYQQQPGWGPSGQYQQQARYGARGARQQKKSPITGIAVAMVAMFIILIIGGIAVATNGFSSSSTPKPPPTETPAPTPTPPPPATPTPAEKAPVITSFTVTPATIAAGQTTNLAWDVDGASSISIDQGIGNVASSGTRALSPTTTTTYTITAANSAGEVTKSAMVTVTTISAPVINSFSASSDNITRGGSAVLQWVTSGATTVSISPGIGTVSPSGTQTVSPTDTTTYTLTATNSAGSVTASDTIIVVAQGPPVINSFTANPPTIRRGEFAMLVWDISGATSVSIDQGIGTRSPTSFPVVSPQSTTTYTLIAHNSAGSTQPVATTVTVTQ